ncbi:DUF2513 domain-containing protein [Bacillus pumilus]|uniref:DUF2513 domain-containing protein n=2 Tax=Bacteria TaxID=2 RepID=A0AAE3WGS3_BACPU|nr:DUF2513 domain-containing protein [Bacillus pumilus]MDF9459370.1 DUF2513 domain-containing protein [Bacillus pumilus]MDR4249014.1 DUF2513 domain-containing protein [Bacillus pumilus]
MSTIKRDMSLIREILIYLEEDDNPTTWRIISIDGREPKEVSYHLKLLTEARMIEGRNAGVDQYLSWYARSLTNDGHDLLDSMRNETVFNKVKKDLGETFSSISLGVIKEICIDATKQWAKSKIGIQP